MKWAIYKIINARAVATYLLHLPDIPGTNWTAAEFLPYLQRLWFHDGPQIRSDLCWRLPTDRCLGLFSAVKEGREETRIRRLQLWSRVLIRGDGGIRVRKGKGNGTVILNHLLVQLRQKLGVSFRN